MAYFSLRICPERNSLKIISLLRKTVANISSQLITSTNGKCKRIFCFFQPMLVSSFFLSFFFFDFFYLSVSCSFYVFIFVVVHRVRGETLVALKALVDLKRTMQRFISAWVPFDCIRSQFESFDFRSKDSGP